MSYVLEDFEPTVTFMRLATLPLALRQAAEIAGNYGDMRDYSMVVQ
jgi:hypothetical protein